MNTPINLSPAPWKYEDPADDSIETIIDSLRSTERLFFDPGETSSLLNTKSTTSTTIPYKQSIAMSLDSTDPCGDFRRSMEEMVEAHGLKDWAALEELLGCYLKVNCETNHVYIIAAFVELLLTLSFVSESDSSSSCNHSFTISPSSDLPSSPLSLSQLLDQDNS